MCIFELLREYMSETCLFYAFWRIFIKRLHSLRKCVNIFLGKTSVFPVQTPKWVNRSGYE